MESDKEPMFLDMEKTRVVFQSDSPYGDYHVGELGIVDGYVRGGNDDPYAVVIKEDGSFVLAFLSSIKVFNDG